MARCPAHDDRTPSLSVDEGDGTVLLKCHAECPTEDVLAAVGLEFADLYPGRGGDRARRPRTGNPVNWRQVNKGLLRELDVLEIAARQRLGGEPFSEEDAQRLHVALERVSALRSRLHAHD